MMPPFSATTDLISARRSSMHSGYAARSYSLFVSLFDHDAQASLAQYLHVRDRHCRRVDAGHDQNKLGVCQLVIIRLELFRFLYHPCQHRIGQRITFLHGL